MSSDLFEFAEKDFRTEISSSGPLAFRMRPQSLEEFIGQNRLLGAGRPLIQWIETDRIPSLILWGPPGCGKTTLAGLIAQRTQSDFCSLSAVMVGVKEIKEWVTRAKEVYKMSRRKTILFFDEIHRFNRSQQDALLPHVEDGSISLIGATTENPSYAINSALLSRVRVLRFDRLEPSEISQVISRALEDPVRGLGGFLKLTPEAIAWLSLMADGDARRALTALEAVALAAKPSQGPLDVGQVKLALDVGMDRQPTPYDKTGDDHYQAISAFIKSIRGSDLDASLYYLARMLEGGEDPLFIARRLVIFASEDVGNADPRGLMLAVAAKEAVEFVGMPEARINLAQVVIYLASAPKSRSAYEAIDRAIEEVRRSGALPIPVHFNHSYLPNEVMAREISDKKFYVPNSIGYEGEILKRLEQFHKSLAPCKKN